MRKKFVLALATLLTMVACNTKPLSTNEEKKYPKVLFTPGDLATVELEISDNTWKKITTKASDKEYYQCAVTINGERFDSVAIRTKGASSLDDVKTMKSNRYSFTLK